MYQALYRKWRPRTFDDVVGQEAVCQTLKNQVLSGQLSHAYLFTGSRGTGKTSMAKILAKAANCLSPREGNPCGECAICRGVDDGSLFDILEIDAASNNGVDNIRDLREEATMLPAQARYRVYIIDEVHMLSTGAFNALLKIMEEPPAHILFILATTEVHKVPATILSRCQRFDFKRIDSAKIAAHLVRVAQAEGIALEEDAALTIARLADGGMRDALSMLDLCSSFGEKIDAATAAKALGVTSNERLFAISAGILSGDTGAVLQAADELAAQSVSAERLCEQLIGHFRNLLVARTVPKPEKLILCLPEERQQYIEQAERFTAPELIRVLEVLQDGLITLGRVSQKKPQLEITLLRAAAPELAKGSQDLAARLDALEQRLAAGALPAASPPRAKPAAPRPAPKAPEPAAAEPAEPPQEQAQPLLVWQDIMERLKTANPALFGALCGSSAYLSGSRILIDSENSLFFKMMRENDFTRRSLKQAILEVTGAKYGIGPYRRQEQQTDPSGAGLEELIHSAKKAGVDVHISE